jgi:hypothetical protein
VILEPDALADLAAETREDFDHRARSSRPTPELGAPDLGLGWRDTWDDEDPNGPAIPPFPRPRPASD